MHDESVSLVWLLVPLGAMLWRVRGGLINNLTGKANWMGFNDTVVRVIWAVGMAVAYGALAGWTWVVDALALNLFLGCVVVGWFGAQLYPTKFRDIALLSLSGFIRMSFAAFVGFHLQFPLLLLVGAMCGPIYWLGGKLPQKPDGWDFWQEWLFGAAIGAGLAGGVLCSHP